MKVKPKKRPRPEWLPVNWKRQMLDVRTEHDLSQGELAEKIGVHWITLQRWESGKNVPHRFMWERFEQVKQELVVQNGKNRK